MALSKSKTLPNGAIGSYWRIMSATLNKQTMTVTCHVELCMDQAHNTSPLGCAKTYIYTVNKTQSEGDLVAQGYAYIKTKAASQAPNLGSSGTHTYDTDLSGATDV